MDDEAIHRCYAEVLGRPADPDGLAAYRRVELSEAECRARLANSTEALARAGDGHRLEQIGPYLQWPYLWHLCLPRARVLYAPVPKNGSTRLKRLMAALSDSPLRSEMLAGDTNEVIERRFTGLAVMDRTHDEIAEAFGGDDYLRVAVVRDPFERLVSAYWEKFVVNRRLPGNVGHTAPVVAAIAGEAGRRRRIALRSDGPTFAEFVAYLDRTEDDALDPHWRPQRDFLGGVEWDLLVGMEHLDHLEEVVAARADGPPARHEDRSNVTRRPDAAPRPGAADLRPRRLLAADRPPNHCFLTPEVESTIARRYAGDLDLHAARHTPRPEDGD